MLFKNCCRNLFFVRQLFEQGDIFHDFFKSLASALCQPVFAVEGKGKIKASAYADVIFLYGIDMLINAVKVCFDVRISYLESVFGE